MLGWNGELRRGKRFLARHNPEAALQCFERATSECPVERSKELAQILFYFGITLRKLGMNNCALKSWGAAQRLHKHKLSAGFLQRFSNSYGMVKQATESLDDWKAFYSVHLERYLHTKNSHRIGADAERDMIVDLIFEAWKNLNETYDISLLSTGQKLSLFRATEIIYPAFSVEQAQRANDTTISVDFNRKKKMLMEDHCFCGSGLPYRLCCGRTPGVEELENGII